MKRQRVTEEMATAYHESGHAVIAWRFHIRFEKVTIAPDKSDSDSLGYLVHSKAPKWFRPDIEISPHVFVLAKNHIIISLAGQIAEAKARGQRPKFGMESDNQKAVDLAFRINGSARATDAFLHFCWCIATDHVETGWKGIKKVSEALIERKTLSYRDVLIELIGREAVESGEHLKRRNNFAR